MPDCCPAPRTCCVRYTSFLPLKVLGDISFICRFLDDDNHPIFGLTDCQGLLEKVLERPYEEIEGRIKYANYESMNWSIFMTEA